MNVRLVEALTREDRFPPVPLQDRVYARAFALTVRGAWAEGSVAELMDLAEDNPHLLGAVQRRLTRLADENRGEEHADRAVALTTYAWLRAIAAA